jgi:hypothetical protein
MPGLTVTLRLTASVFHLDGRPHYLHVGWFLISDANLVVVLSMIAVFALAIWLPFPHGAGKHEQREEGEE